MNFGITATAPEISGKIARCRGHMTTIRNKMDGNVRTLKTHPANDAAATELKRHLDDINAQFWRASYLMEIYISVIEVSRFYTTRLQWKRGHNDEFKMH